MNEGQWTSPFNVWPAWSCPACGRSTIRAVDKALQTVETGESRREHAHEAWEPDWITKRFAQVFECSDDRCKEIVTCIGKTSYSEITWQDEDGQYQRDYLEFFHPKYFWPPLRYFQIIPECPKPVSDQLDRAFGSAWSDTASSANALRCALEEILSDQKVRKIMVNRNRKRVILSLHERIRRYGLKDQEGQQFLEALKWLGNTGSHAGDELSISDLLEAFSIFEHAIEHIYLKKSQKIKKLAGAMIKRKGRAKAR